MKRNSKPPEERRRELVTVASSLFSEKGYTNRLIYTGSAE